MQDDQLRIRKKESVGIQIKSINNLKFQYLDYLVLSPSINHKLKIPHEVVSKALKEKVKITTDLEFLNISNTKFLIGVTGTNGKSTTIKFIENCLSNSKINVLLLEILVFHLATFQ